MKNDNNRLVFLNGIRHVEKLPSYTFMDMQIDYVLYLISLLSVVTIEQLSEVCDSSRRQLAMALQYGIRKNLVESESMVYYGVNVNYYFLTQEGNKRVFKFLVDHDKEVKDYDVYFRKNLIHFLETSELYLSQFNFSRMDDLEREKWLYLEKNQTIRVDAALLMRLDQYEYQFAIEHDRGTERMDVLMKKFNEGYNYQLLSSEPQIMILTISREDLITRKKALTISHEPKLEQIKKYISAMDKVSRLMTKCNFTQLSEVWEALTYAHPASPLYIDVILNESNEAITLVKEVAKAYDIRTKKELTQKKDEFEASRNNLYYKLLKSAPIGPEKSRVEKIREAIMRLDNKTQLDLDIVSKYSASLRERGAVIDGIFYLPSFKTQLLTHEFVIGPLVEIKTWMTDFANHHDNVELWIKNTFNHHLTNINKGVELQAGNVLIKKVLSAYHGIDKRGRTIAVMQLDLQYNLSDKLKLECLGKDLIVHQYDELNVLVREGEKEISRLTF